MKNVFFVVLFLSGCATTPIIPDVSEISYEGDGVLIFKSDITRSSVDRFFELNEIYPIDKIYISSRGGDVASGIDMGLIVYESRIDVVVDDICASSCANYIFPAASEKYIKKDSLLVWHGSAFQGNFVKAGEISLEYRSLQKKEYLFYEKIGVNPLIGTLGQNKNIRIGIARFYQGDFEYSVDVLNFLGVDNINFLDGYWNWRENRLTNSEMRNVFKIDMSAVNISYCDAVVEYVDKTKAVFGTEKNMFGYEGDCP